MQDKTEILKQWIDKCDNIVFFGGAGVSTESGVPDFRSKDGLYNQHDVRFDRYRPEYLLSHSCLVDEPKVYFEFHRQKMDTRKIEPNFAHKYLAELEKQGKLKAVITQNIDGLHQKAGSRKVYEIHGSALRNYCSKCGKIYPEDYIFNSTEDVPRCECGGVIRPDITLYEECLPDDAVSHAINAITQAQMLIIGGTSLNVYPAAGLIDDYRGSRLVLVNKSATPRDDRADLILREPIGEVFAQLP